MGCLFNHSSLRRGPSSVRAVPVIHVPAALTRADKVGPWGVWTSLVAQTVRRLPAMRETWVQFLGQEDPLEKEMATHSSTSSLENPMDREA